jgi:branched-chain amino acid transport system substrate-binding protein
VRPEGPTGGPSRGRALFGGTLGLLVLAAAALPRMAAPSPPEESGLESGHASVQDLTPYKEAGRTPLEFHGPGRDQPDPDVDEVRLGWFGPSDPDHPSGGEFWRGASLAVEEVNRDGGYHGKPFRLVPGWSDSPWAAGVVQVTRMAYEQRVWAILGAIDGASAHIAEQVALKAWVPLVSSGSTDGTANMASVPWFFSCLPSDERQAPWIVGALGESAGSAPFAIAAAAEHDAHAALVAVERELGRRRLTPAGLLEFDVRDPEAGAVATRLVETRARALLVLAPAAVAGRLVAALRARGFDGVVVGGATLALNAFRRAAGPAGEGVLVPRLWEPTPRWDSFVRMYENRWGESPDHAAAQSYDAVWLTAEAVRRAGLNRARIDDALRALVPWRGAAGIVQWDALGRNERPVGLAVWRAGRLVPVARTRGDR